MDVKRAPQAYIRCARITRANGLIKLFFIIASSLWILYIIPTIQKLREENKLLHQLVDFENVAPTALPSLNINDRRKCSRLVLFLHIHKAGGTSMLQFMSDSDIVSIDKASAQFKPPLVQLMSTHKLTVPSYGMYGSECDQILVRSDISSLREIKVLNSRQRRCFGDQGSRNMKGPEYMASSSSSEISYPPLLQLSDASLWRGIHKAGSDYVAFEYNFLPPHVFVDHSEEIRSAAVSIAQLRDPWARFHSTYHREIYRICKRMDKTKEKGSRAWMDKPCLEQNSLARWMRDTHHEINPTYPGILKPNFMVRMLNGLADHPNLNLTQDHLELAKMALEKFDLVLYIEMPEEERVAALRTFFRTKDTAKLKHKSNNLLQSQYPEQYGKIIAESSLSKPAFMELNSLDMELYDFTKTLVEQRQQTPVVHC